MDLDSGLLDPELPYPPAVSRRGAAPAAVADDAALMPPFSRASLLGAGVAAGAWTAPEPEAAWLPELEPEPEAEVTASPPAVAETAPLAITPDADQALAAEVAGRLERMAEALRNQGFDALLQPRSEREPIDVVLASVIAGFLARR